MSPPSRRGRTAKGLPTEGAHAHGVTEAGGLGAAGLHAVAQLACLGQVPEELGPASPTLGVRLRLLDPLGLFDAAKSFGPFDPFGSLGSSELLQLLRGLPFALRHRHTTPGPSLPLSLGRAV